MNLLVRVRRGNIKKVVEFDFQNNNGVTFVNLSFGDWNEPGKCINDRVISNNQDSRKILATVAAIVLNFCEKFPDMTIYAEGSTPARTRLYQMAIVAHYQEIELLFHMYGLLNNVWQPFKKGVNFEAFAARLR